MLWILKKAMRPIAYDKLEALYNEKDHIIAAIARAKKSKSKVNHLYELAQQNNVECLKWERWLT
jgi:hypothetical protein